MNNQPPKIGGVTPLPPRIKPLDVIEPLQRPSVVGMEIKMKMPRSMCEKTFQRARFLDSDFDEKGMAIITEKLRVAKDDEPVTVTHHPSGVKLCVDHYEKDGVTL